MSKSNDDRRIRRTKRIIRQTLTELLAVKDLKDISVSELTEKADINRGTFYLHYKDIYDLFEQIERETIEDFTNTISKYKKPAQTLWMPMFLDLLKYVAANSQIFLAILKTKENTFLNQIIELHRPKTKEEWRTLFPGGKEEHYEYYYSFITHGCVSMLLRWFENGMKESPESIAKMAEKMMTCCIKSLS
ncbi:MAG: TetR/AcrR family transcriptional regulator [Clostridiaceae bacterium]|nr:TetR/AcrR family transcriptional regulator [Clostridiaceae bacterium]